MNDHYGYIALLPRSENGIRELIKNFTLDFLQETLQRLKPREGHVELLKLRMERKDNLNMMFHDWGMISAFSQEKADFSKMWPRNVFLQDVSLKSSLEINEEMAMANNEMEIVGGVLGGIEESEPAPPFVFVTDHPFLFVIYDHEHQLPVFIGIVYKP